MKENNHYLAEGAECKELLISKNKELRLVDSALAVKEKIETRLSTENSALENSNTELLAQVKETHKGLVKATEAVQAKDAEVQTEKRRKRIWMGIAIPESVFIICCVIGAILIL